MYKLPLLPFVKDVVLSYPLKLAVPEVPEVPDTPLLPFTPLVPLTPEVPEVPDGNCAMMNNKS